MTPNFYLWLIPLLPLAGAAVNGLFGKRASRTGVSVVALLGSGAALAMALRAAAMFSTLQLPYQQFFAHWIRSGSFAVDFSFYLDQLSLVMLLVVTGVGFLIHVYSVGYMWEDPSYYRFFTYLNLFLFFMLTLILAGNYLLMFVGWEGVGLASYLLIGFWFTKDSAASAGKKAFIVNRIGDFGFLIGLFLLIQHFGTLSFDGVFTAVANLAPGAATEALLSAVGILLMVGACGKSAQIPLYVWLPDAMEGPTPVSALIHAATMVTAGVYMVARSHVIFAGAPLALNVVAIVGTLTAVFAATIGITQTDIKKVLAYSTVSQLGYMFIGCGVGAFSAGVFHLMTHAFFKGLLFLAAGSVIHGVSGEQDMRRMGGLRSYMPWTFWTMTVATFAIAGFPPLAGFFSKDEILWMAFSSPHGSWVFWLVGVATAFITSFYMFRLWFMTFFGEYRGGGDHHDDHGHGHGHDAGHGHDPHESPMVMLAPLMILAVLSIIGGWVGIGGRFEHFLAPAVGALPEAASEGGNMESLLMAVSIAAAVGGFGFAWLLYFRSKDLPKRIAEAMGGLYQSVLHKYYVDEIYDATLVRPLITFSRAALWHGADQGVIDASVNGGATVTREVSDGLRQMQSGNLRSYAGWIAAGSAVVIAYLVWAGVR